jgi:type I restriction enzyme S subunit
MNSKQAAVGLVPDYWAVEELRAFCSLITYGFTNPMPDADEGPWKLTAKDVVDGRINYDTARRTTQFAFDRLTDKSRPRLGDVLLTKDGSIGRVAVVDRDGICINQSVALIRPNNRVIPDFLKYLLFSPHYQKVMEGDSDGSTIKHIYITRIDKMQVAVPPVEEQKKFLAVIKGIDDRITLLRETNTTLETISQALFKSWFVDFDPVHAKMQGRAPVAMDEATGALFPDSFEESELGAVPKGWQVKSLDSVASFLNGLALQKFPPTGDDDLPVIKIAQLRKGDTVGADLASRSIKPEYVVQNGDVLFSWSGSLEVEIWCGGEGALNQHLFKVTSGAFPKWFYFMWTRHHLEHFRQVAASKATTMGHIQRAHLTDAKVLVPGEEVLRAADSVLVPIMHRLIENSLQAYNMAALRDTLLPRLISGQLLMTKAEEAMA